MVCHWLFVIGVSSKLSSYKKKSIFSENTIDEVIRILDLDEGCKNQIWSHLNFAKQSFDKPSPTQLGTTPSKATAHTKDVHQKICASLEALEIFQEEVQSHQLEAFVPKLNKDQIAVEALREGSKNPAISSGLIGWGAPRPFDTDLSSAISALQKLEAHFEVADKLISVSSRGKNKETQNRTNQLILSFCGIYKEFTGKVPMAWDTGSSAINIGKIYGTIIPFLQTLLSQTNYSRSTSEQALQQKLERLREETKDLDIWKSSKNQK